MMWTKQIRRKAIAAAVLATCLAGCLHFKEGPAPSPGLLGAGGVGKVSDRQAADVQVALGRSLEKRGDDADALAAYMEAIKRDPKRTDALLRLAVLNDRRGRFNESAEWYRKALQTSPGNPEVYCDMGYSLYLQRRWAESEMNFQQALAVKPDHARAHN